MKKVLSLAVLLHGGNAVTLKTTEFDTYRSHHAREYAPGSTEYEMRRAIYEKNMKEIEEHNSKPNRLWTAGPNLLTDRTESEIKALNGYRGHGVDGKKVSLLQISKDEQPKTPLPREFTNWTSLWTTKYDQIRSQTCGNCWAHATTSMFEAHMEIYHGTKRRYNVMELTHCTENPWKCGGSGGCSGATAELAIHHVMVNGFSGKGNEAHHKCPENSVSFVDRNEKAPHEWGGGTRTAAADAPGRRDYNLVGWKRMPVNKYEPLMRALVEHGPIAVAVSTDWRHYKNGIYDGCNKDAIIGHAMLLIAYGEDKDLGVGWWMLQNSYGKSFGENGHIRLLRRSDEEKEYCGEDSAPQDGTICEGGPSKVRVCGMCGILYDTVVPIFEGNTETARKLAQFRGTSTV